jgi:hypothetical protein
MRLALSLALARAGNNMAARMAIIAMTTSNSINVKPPRPAPTDRLETLPPVRLGSRSDVSSAAVFANVFFIVFKLVAVSRLAHVRLRRKRRVSFQTPSYFRPGHQGYRNWKKTFAFDGLIAMFSLVTAADPGTGNQLPVAVKPTEFV